MGQGFLAPFPKHDLFQPVVVGRIEVVAKRLPPSQPLGSTDGPLDDVVGLGDIAAIPVSDETSLMQNLNHSCRRDDTFHGARHK